MFLDEVGAEAVDGVVDFVFGFGAGDDEFAVHVEEEDDFGGVHAVDEAGELFRFVHGAVEDVGGFFDVDLFAEAGGGDDVDDLDGGGADDEDAAVFELLDDA